MRHEAGQDVAALLARAELAEAMQIEVEHRAKNTLQLAAATLRVQSIQASDERIKSVLLDSARRLNALASIHFMLQRRTGTVVELDQYLALVGEAYVEEADARIRVDVMAPPLSVPVGTAMTVGLLVSELVINALKHAFPGDTHGLIEVIVARTDDHLRLVVEDDGVGLGQQASGGQGYKIIDLLSRQLDGSLLRMTGPRGGCRIEVHFPYRPGA